MKKKIIKIAIDYHAAAGAGTLANKLSEHYNLAYLDTGKIFRYIAYIKLKNPKKFNKNTIKKKINTLKPSDLRINKLLTNQIGIEASIIAKKNIYEKLFIHIKLDLLINHQKNIMVHVWMEEI